MFETVLFWIYLPKSRHFIYDIIDINEYIEKEVTQPYESIFKICAAVAELADAQDLGSCTARCGGFKSLQPQI